MHSLSRRNSGFTLVEILAVIAVIGVLLALLIPAVQAARESSRRTMCQNNLRQLGLGLASFEAVNKKLPPGKKWSGPPNDPASFTMAWSSFLLGHIEEEAINDAIDIKRPFTDPVNLPATTKIVSVYLCPSTSDVEEHRTADGHLFNLGGMPGEGLACIDYLGVSGPDKDAKHPITKQVYGRQRGVLIGTKGLPLEDELIEPPPIVSAKIVDGLTHTMCITECTGRGVSVKDGVIDALHGAWASGNNVTHIDDGINGTEIPKVWYKERIHSDHPGGAHIVMCDASVHFFTDDTSKKLIYWLATRDGHEDIAADVFQDQGARFDTQRRHMAVLEVYRYERKFVVSERAAESIRQFVRGYLDRDRYMDAAGRDGYRVCSLYLDTPQLALYRQSKQGVKNRYKLRIRYYDDDAGGQAFIEIKRRTSETVHKLRAAVSKPAIERFLRRGTFGADLLVNNDTSLRALSEFCEIQARLNAEGTAFVDYRREAYVSNSAEGVRVTFDRHIAGHCYRADCGLTPIGESRVVIPKGVVLELKYNGRAPRWMHDLVVSFNLQRISLPKYVRSVDALRMCANSPVTFAQGVPP